MLRYQLFPRSVGLTDELDKIIKCFEVVYEQIKSPENTLNSDGVLRHLRPNPRKGSTRQRGRFEIA